MTGWRLIHWLRPQQRLLCCSSTDSCPQLPEGHLAAHHGGTNYILKQEHTSKQVGCMNWRTQVLM
jgi:hypothetical protein